MIDWAFKKGVELWEDEPVKGLVWLVAVLVPIVITVGGADYAAGKVCRRGN